MVEEEKEEEERKGKGRKKEKKEGRGPLFVKRNESHTELKARATLAPSKKPSTGSSSLENVISLIRHWYRN